MEASTFQIDYNDVWDNSWSNGEAVNNYGGGASPGANDISADPQYADQSTYRLVSTSPCIDAGDPDDDYSNEPAPNGGRINMGAYGNTADAASQTP